MGLVGFVDIDSWKFQLGWRDIRFLLFFFFMDLFEEDFSIWGVWLWDSWDRRSEVFTFIIFFIYFYIGKCKWDYMIFFLEVFSGVLLYRDVSRVFQYSRCMLGFLEYIRDGVQVQDDFLVVFLRLIFAERMGGKQEYIEGEVVLGCRVGDRFGQIYGGFCSQNGFFRVLYCIGMV